MRIILPILGSLLLIACGADNGSAGSAPATDPTASTAAPSSAKGNASETKSGSAAFGRGRTSIYGIRIPSGMYPASGPPKVYRFEGLQPLPQVAVLIRDQVVAKQEVREGEGYLFRFARAKAKPSESEVTEPVAVRLFNTGTAGTTLDIWLEKEYRADLPNRATRTGIINRTGRPSRAAVKYDAKAKTKQKADLGQTMRILRKALEGEPLTEKERANDAFN